MTEMHGAALAPIQPPISEQDRAHPRFAEYQRYRSGMTRLLVECCSFQNWLASMEREAINERWVQHLQYPAFVEWMRANQGGERGRNPAPFPQNFELWLSGQRW